MKMYIGFIFSSVYLLGTALITSIPLFRENGTLKIFLEAGMLGITVVSMMTINKLLDKKEKENSDG
jgi:hypothetical protein